MCADRANWGGKTIEAATPCEPSPMFKPYRDELEDGLVPSGLGAGAYNWINTRDPIRMAYLIQVNPILSSAVYRIRSTVSSLQLTVDESQRPGASTRKEIDYWTASLRNPWRGGTRADMLSKVAWSLIARGDCLIKVTPGVVQATFQVLSSDWETKYDTAGLPMYLEHSNKKDRLELVTWTGVRPVKPFGLRVCISELAENFSHAPLPSVLSAKSVFDMIYQQALAILHNRPALSGVLSTDAKLTETQMADLQATLRRYRTGGLKAGGVIALSNSLKTEFKQFNAGLEGVLTPEARQDAATDISIGLGVPLEIIGLGKSTYANMETSRLLFYENTILPLYGDPIAEALSVAALPPYAPIMVDRDRIDAFRTARVRSMATMNNVFFLTDNEKRAFFGFAPTKEQLGPPGLQQRSVPND